MIFQPREECASGSRRFDTRGGCCLFVQAKTIVVELNQADDEQRKREHGQNGEQFGAHATQKG
jgi:hypothetical protein